MIKNKKTFHQNNNLRKIINTSIDIQTIKKCINFGKILFLIFFSAFEICLCAFSTISNVLSILKSIRSIREPCSTTIDDISLKIELSSAILLVIFVISYKI